MRLFRPGFLVRWLYPEALIRQKTHERILFLTFDDGPDPLSTPVIIDLLDKYNIKALFFCNGRAAEKYPVMMELIKSRGHITGNHGFNHLSGWNTSTVKYLDDIETASAYTSSTLFRPPYGHISLRQYLNLKKRYKIILWDLMPYDFDRSFSASNVLNVLKKKIRPGCVIVLHDTPQSGACKILEEFIRFSLEEGYRFELVSV